MLEFIQAMPEPRPPFRFEHLLEKLWVFLPVLLVVIIVLLLIMLVKRKK